MKNIYEILVTLCGTKFQENSFSCFRAVTYEQTDRQTDTATFISVVCNFSLQRRQKKINALHAESLTASSGRNSFAAL